MKKEFIFTIIASGLYVSALIGVFKAFEAEQATAIVFLIAMGDLMLHEGKRAKREN